jgi:hypothetical protein
MTTEKKPVGRPKKEAAEPVPKNPDMKLATRGYVKCIARLSRDHRHNNNATSGVQWNILIAVSGLLAMVVLSSLVWVPVNMTTAGILVLAVGWSIVANCCVQTVIMAAIDSDSTYTPDGETPKEIRGYVPPEQKSKYDRENGIYCEE